MIVEFVSRLRFLVGVLTICAVFSLLTRPAHVENISPLKDNDRAPAALSSGTTGPCGTGGDAVSLSSRSPRPLSAAEECALKPTDIFRECEQCPEMVVVPAGEFNMGSPESEVTHKTDEAPRHVVTIAKPFAVGKFPVTMDQFAAFVTETGFVDGKCEVLEGNRYVVDERRSWRIPGFRGVPQPGTYAAVCLNQNDAKAYLDWLSGRTGKSYRLLSESEWEYAARAGGSTSYPWGDEIGRNNTNCIDCVSAWENQQRPAPVGSFAANAFGLYDMHGNVAAWVQDCYHDSYVGAPSDGSAWTTGDCFYRVVRGGSWNSFSEQVRSADRSYFPLRFRRDDIGFRVARTL
jgi:formylglycine-generating enzyme required for sulfatase activity